MTQMLLVTIDREINFLAVALIFLHDKTRYLRPGNDSAKKPYGKERNPSGFVTSEVRNEVVILHNSLSCSSPSINDRVFFPGAASPEVG